MYKPLYYLFFIIFFVFHLFTNVAISQEKFNVVDQNNQPLSNVVIELITSTPSLTKPQSTYVMDQIGKSFKPRLLVVPKNSLVNFPNKDDIRHHVYSFSPAKPFELKLYSDKPKAPLHFNNSGIVVLGCNIHDSMVGYIYVAETHNVYVSNEQGEVAIGDDFEDIKQVYVWHEQATEGAEYRASYTKEQLVNADGTIHLILNTAEPEPSNNFENLALYVQ